MNYFNTQVLMMVTEAETSTSTLHHNKFTYLDYVFLLPSPSHTHTHTHTHTHIYIYMFCFILLYSLNGMLISVNTSIWILRHFFFFFYSPSPLCLVYCFYFLSDWIAKSQRIVAFFGFCCCFWLVFMPFFMYISPIFRQNHQFLFPLIHSSKFLLCSF